MTTETITTDRAAKTVESSERGLLLTLLLMVVLGVAGMYLISL